MCSRFFPEPAPFSSSWPSARVGACLPISRRSFFIYLTPVLFTNSGLLSPTSEVYGTVRTLVLPMMLTLLLIQIDVGTAFRVMGKGVFVMLFGMVGVMVGAPLAFFLVRDHLGTEGWKAFGSLAGSWIGGTGNLAAVSEMISTPGAEFGLAVLADNAVYIVWLPILLSSKKMAGWFAGFTGVSSERLKKMEAALEAMEKDHTAPQMRDYIYLLFVSFAVTWLASLGSETLPELKPYISASTWKILLVTSVGILLSFTPLRGLRGSHELAMALVYLYVARMGAVADLSGIGGSAVWFVFAALLWIFIHGAFCLLGARIMKVDVHTAAIASAANIGGAASAPIVAAHHRESLVPVSILMALIGYALGNYAAFLAAQMCRMLA